MELPNSFVWMPKIIFDAKSVWCRKEGDFEKYKAGFQFQSLDIKIEKQDNRLVEKFKH